MRLLILLIASMQIISAQVKPEDVTSNMIKKKIESLTNDILEKQDPDGKWAYSGHNSGSTALHLLALSTAGLTEKHPAIRKGVAYLLENFPEGDVYSMSMYAVALH